jgi:hypothetical protein
MLVRCHLSQSLGVVVYTCHPNLQREAEIGGNDGSRLAQVKRFARSHFKGKNLGMVICACHPRDGEKLKIEG